MPPDPTNTAAVATAACESVLAAVRKRYADADVWRSLVKIIDRLLSRRMELTDAYEELYRAMPDWRALDHFFDAVLVTAAFHNPDEINDARDARTDLEATNAEIAKLGRQIAEQLRHRDKLNNTSSFSTSTCYHVLDLVEEASSSNALFTTYLKEDLAALRYQFDLKYWPSLASCMEALAADAEHATVYANNPLTKVSTNGPHRGREADFFKALLHAIEERSTRRGCFVPDGYRPSDQALATLGNCALDLPPEKLIDGTQVKSLRQRLRAKRPSNDGSK
jgi:hypothetical protein